MRAVLKKQKQAAGARAAREAVAGLVLGHEPVRFGDPPIHGGEVGVVGLEGEAAADRPPAFRQVGEDAPGVAARVGRVVVGARGEQRPVEELGGGVVRVAVAVDHVDDREAADGDGEEVAVTRSRQLVGTALVLDLAATEAEGLADGQARDVDDGSRIAYPIDDAVGEGRHAARLAEASAAGHLGVEEQLGPAPQAQVRVERGHEGRGGLGLGVQAVGSAVGRGERRVGLGGRRELVVQAVPLFGARGTDRLDGQRGLVLRGEIARTVGARGGGAQQHRDEGRQNRDSKHRGLI